MNRAPFIFLGVFSALAFSFVGLVLTNQLTYGSFTTHVDEDEGKAFPLQSPGIAAQGKLVYQDLGCVTCHTQQVRRAGFGSDTGTLEEGGRNWGTRQSVARDYLREERVLLGSYRIGPDLRNLAARKNAAGEPFTAEWHYKHLFDPQLTSKDSTMPRHAFLFETRKIIGQQSSKALVLPGDYAAKPGYEIVPSARAEALVAYLLSLNDTYAYPETKNVYTAPAKKEGAAEHGKTEHGKTEEKKEGHK